MSNYLRNYFSQKKKKKDPLVLFSRVFVIFLFLYIILSSCLEIKISLHELGKSFLQEVFETTYIQHVVLDTKLS